MHVFRIRSTIENQENTISTESKGYKSVLINEQHKTRTHFLLFFERRYLKILTYDMFLVVFFTDIPEHTDFDGQNL